MKYNINYKDAVVNRGNIARLRRLIERAERGERLVIGFIGGSITQGAQASRQENCYAFRVYDWWSKRFPESIFLYVNAGIGATTSELACARADEDLLVQKPDFVIVEFSVNDANDAHYKETYEGLVRHILLSGSHPALLLLHNVRYDSGESAEDIHLEIGRHYHIPCISMKSCIWPKLRSGELSEPFITQDHLHPNDAGHEIVAAAVTSFIEEVAQTVEPEINATKEIAAENAGFPAPLTKNRYEYSRRIRSVPGPESSHIHLEGFEPDTEFQDGVADCFKHGWTAVKTGAQIAFDVNACCIGVHFRRTISLPAPIAAVVIDGKESEAIILDANFGETWGDKAELATILEEDADHMHHVSIRIMETHENDRKPFYLIALTVAARKQ